MGWTAAHLPGCKGQLLDRSQAHGDLSSVANSSAWVALGRMQEQGIWQLPCATSDQLPLHCAMHCISG